MPVDPRFPVLITGCSSGIGRALVRSCAARGWLVCATARNIGDIADLAGGRTTVQALDVTDEASRTGAIEAAVSRHGGISALVNNAGYALPGAVEDLDLDEVRAQFETNVFGAIRLTQLVVPHMRAQGSGLIVNMSSMGGVLTFPGGGAYHASKYALEAFSDALRFELKGFGIDVLVIQPGLVRTSFGRAAHDRLRGAQLEGPNGAFNRAVALSNVASYDDPASGAGSAEEVAALVCGAMCHLRPRARYRVLRSAHTFMNLRRRLSDRAWDDLMSRFYVRPGARGSDSGRREGD
ncbi:MAG: SDR family NAD(P)-dependent oxidoreductase [Proteobacteria bacterium]|nr:SDR family NAD(P)-dependent oxidoreductase [Pseudomonadota bacterium]